MNNSPLVSIVIATKNEEKNIKRIILDLQKQSYKNIEVIHVDNNSTDKTIEVSQELLDKKYIYNLAEQKNLDGVVNYRGCQVNFGVKKSKGDIVFFPDADMTFDKELIEEAVTLLENKYDALYIPEIVLGNGFFGKIRNFERSFYNETCIDAVRIVKRSFYDRADGFDEKNIPFSPDDWDFTKTLKKINTNIGVTKHKKYHHEEWLNLRLYIEKKNSYIWTFSSYIDKWGKKDPDIIKQFGFYYRYFGVFVEKKKYIKLIKRPILSVGVLIVRFIVGANYVIRKIK